MLKVRTDAEIRLDQLTAMIREALLEQALFIARKQRDPRLEPDHISSAMQELFVNKRKFGNAERVYEILTEGFLK